MMPSEHINPSGCIIAHNNFPPYFYDLNLILFIRIQFNIKHDALSHIIFIQKYAKLLRKNRKVSLFRVYH